MAVSPARWDISGSYFEACNCHAVCPCRELGGRPGSRPTYDVCQFALSWHILNGYADDLPLDGRSTVMAGWYTDTAKQETPWSVVLYVDNGATDPQFDALAAIFLGRAGGGTFANYAQAIGEVHHVRRADISLDHTPRRWRIRADTYVVVSASTPVDVTESVACGIPGLDHPGQEVVADELIVDDAPLGWNLRERCGFATDFHYSF